jgi:hypothetical protein
VRWCLGLQVLELLRGGLAAEYLIAMRVPTEACYDVAGSLRGSVNRRVAYVSSNDKEAVESLRELPNTKSCQPIDGSSNTISRKFATSSIAYATANITHLGRRRAPASATIVALKGEPLQRREEELCDACTY